LFLLFFLPAASPFGESVRLEGETMHASGWRPHTSGSLLGFFNLQLASGIRLNDLTLHRNGAKRWIPLAVVT
jgi:hypothetical protein